MSKSLNVDFSLIGYDIGVRAGGGGGGGGGEGATAPPNFGQLAFFGQREKIWAKSLLKDVSMFI